MRHLLALLVVSFIAPAAWAQDAPREGDPQPLVRGQMRADSLTPTSVHAYALDLSAGHFVYGEANQVSVDVVVTVVGPDGNIVGTFDGPAQGPEPFQFMTRETGLHQIEVRPFEQSVGRYELEVRSAEPLARTPEGRVNQFMEIYNFSDRTPGAVVGVYDSGDVVFAEGYGMADLTHGIPITLNTRFNLGSVSKQFTGLAFAMLAAEGALNLDDPVRKYIPDLPTFEDEVTLRHLLTHTSGYREAYGTLALRGRNTETDLLRREDAINVVRHQPELEFPPGSKFQYNSTAYVILAEIAERVTGQPFPKWMAEHVFAPLGMNNTVIEAEVEEVVPGAASSYASTQSGGYRTAFSNRAYYGAADVYTTVSDLTAWLRNFRTAEVGGHEAINALTTPYVLTSGDTLSYALGIFVAQERGLRRFQHAGGHAGFSARLTYYPELDAGVVVMSNHPSFNTSVSSAIAEAFFGDRMGPEGTGRPSKPSTASGSDEPKRWVPSAEELVAYVGSYHSTEVETAYTIALGDSGLVLSHYRWGETALVPRAADTFSTASFPVSTTLSFARSKEGRVTGFAASVWRTNGVLFVRQE